MQNKETQTFRANFFTYFGLYFLGMNFLAICAALLGVFFHYIFLFYLFAGAAAFLYYVKKNGLKDSIPSKATGILVLISIAVIATSAYFSSPTVFNGRDQGSFSQAAILLAKNHKLDVSFPAQEEFFKIYGPGRALNFPGFDYRNDGRLVSQFPPGYSSWLAVFYSIIGLSGFSVANGISFLIFMLSFYYLMKHYADRPMPFLAALLAITSFVFSWFFKFTLSENLALGIVWFGVLQLVLFLKQKKSLNLFASVASFLILAFTRLEAWFFLTMVLSIVLWDYRHDWREILRILGRKKMAAFLLMLVAFIFSLFINRSLYFSAAKGLYLSFTSSGPSDIALPFAEVTRYMTEIFFQYGILHYLIAALIAFLYFAAKKRYFVLVPFLVVLPAFFYLVHPSVTLDHPWMLRRFMFAVIPASIFYTVVLIGRIYQKTTIKYILSALLLLTNLSVISTTITYTEDKRLLDQTKKIASIFSPTDLVLVDRLASGNGWSMLPGPMYALSGIQSVYFFNPDDAGKIDMNRFKDVYLIIPDESWPLYRDHEISKKMQAVSDYKITGSSIDRSRDKKEDIIKNPISFPVEISGATDGKIFRLEK